MLRVSIESLIKNIMIVDDNIYFEDDKGEMVPHPANRYRVGTDSYDFTQEMLFTGEYLNFNDSNEVEAFKDYCIRQYRNDVYIFNYPDEKPVHVVMDFIDNPTYETEDELMVILKELCVK